MGQAKLVFKTNDNAATIAKKLLPIKGDAQSLSRISAWVEGLVTRYGASVIVETGGVQANETLTLSGATGGNTAVINGVTLTAGTDFAVGASDAQTAENLKNAINNTATINVVAVATRSGAVVTVKAQNVGTLGDAITLSATGGITAGGATLSGGTAGTVTVLELGQTV